MVEQHHLICQKSNLEGLPRLFANCVQAIEDNLHAYLLEFGKVRHGQYFSDSAISWTYTGTPILNRIFNARSDALSSAKISEALYLFAANQVPVTWMTGPSSQAHGLRSYLNQNGFTHSGDWSGMALAEGALPTNSIDPAGFSVQTVSDERSFAQWTKIARCGFSLPEESHAAFQTIFADLLLGENAPFQGFLAYLDHIPAGTCLVHTKAQVSGVYWVATAPQAQRRGVATMLTLAALQKTRRNADQLVILHATPMGKNVYLNMGFKECCRIGLYHWQPPMHT